MERQRQRLTQARIGAPDCGESLSWDGENGHQGSLFFVKATQKALTFQLLFKGDGMASRDQQSAFSLGCPLSSSTFARLNGGLPVWGNLEGHLSRPDL